MERLSTRLRQERERLQLSVKECSEATKIREPFLQALERGEYTILPPVYITSFVRSYASFLGIPAAEVTSMLDDVVETDEYGEQRLVKQTQRVAKVPPVVAQVREQQPSPVKGSTEAEGDRPRRVWETPDVPVRRRIILGVLVVVLGVAAVWWLLSPSSDDPTVGDTSSMTDSDAEIAPADSLILSAVASDTVWLTITSDGFASTQAVLMPGDEAQWSAMEKFSLSLGNAGGATFYRNGQQLEPFGKSGEAVRSVLITRTDIRKSSDVWKPPPPKVPPAKPAATTQSTSHTAQPPKPTAAPQAAAKPTAVVQAPTTRQTAPARQQAPSRASQRVQRQRAVQRRAVQQRRVPARPSRRQAIPDITPAPVRPPQR